MIATDKPPLGEAYLSHIVSFKKWSDYTKADYTPEQWHKACLIHQHQGAPTSKDQCKLPVRTPLGALNKNGVQAAKAALNGARGGVDASPEEKAKAKTQLETLSKELEKNVPAFLAKHSDLEDDDALAHFGIRGMHWGQRKASDTSGGQRQGMSTAKKVAIGTAVAAGAVATALIIRKFGGSSVPKIDYRADIEKTREAVAKMKPAEQLFAHRVSAGQASHARIMSLLQNKKTELDIAASSARIQQLLKQPTPKMPTIDRVLKVERRAKRVATLKNLFSRKPKGPLQLHPVQSIFGRVGKTNVTDMGDVNARLMSFTDRGLGRGGS